MNGFDPDGTADGEQVALFVSHQVVDDVSGRRVGGVL